MNKKQTAYKKRQNCENKRDIQTTAGILFKNKLAVADLLVLVFDDPFAGSVKCVILSFSVVKQKSAETNLAE